MSKRGVVANLIKLYKGGEGAKHALQTTGESTIQAEGSAHTNTLRAGCASHISGRS